MTTSRFSGDTRSDGSSGASLVFTPANFSVPQLVTIAAAADADTANDNAVFRVTAPAIATYDLTVNGIDTPTTATKCRLAQDSRCRWDV